MVHHLGAVARKTESPERMAVRVATAQQELKRLNDFDYGERWLDSVSRDPRGMRPKPGLASTCSLVWVES